MKIEFQFLFLKIDFENRNLKLNFETKIKKKIMNFQIEFLFFTK